MCGYFHIVDSATSEDATTAPSILIVEDEPVSRRALSLLLVASGFQTQTARSAEEALRMIEASGPGEFAPRIALVDLDLPGMSGIELIRKMRRSTPLVRSILVTAAGEERIRRLLLTDSVQYLSKPLDFERLLIALQGAEHAN